MKNKNMVAVQIEECKYCSLGQLTAAMFEVGGSIAGIFRSALEHEG